MGSSTFNKAGISVQAMWINVILKSNSQFSYLNPEKSQVLGALTG